MYADAVTPSMERAIRETNRRREIQTAYNTANGIVPKTIVKEVRELIDIRTHKDTPDDFKNLTRAERMRLIEQLKREMKNAAKLLEFEHAAYLRDRIQQLETGKKG
jgi:excinuclease ABC subunit B